MVKWMDGQTDVRWMNKWMDGSMDREQEGTNKEERIKTEGRMVGQMNEYMDGWISGRVEKNQKKREDD